MTILINLYGQPGAGKSTTRAGVFHLLKLAKVNCEEVVEFAKDLTWASRFADLACQPYVFGKQLRNIERVWGQVDVIITDSPLMLSSYYGRKYNEGRYPSSFFDAIEDIARRTPSLDFFIKRVKEYNPKGRNQTEAESDEVGRELSEMLDRLNVMPITVLGDEHAPRIIAEHIQTFLALRRS